MAATGTDDGLEVWPGVKVSVPQVGVYAPLAAVAVPSAVP